MASRAKVAPQKSLVLDWSDLPPNWLTNMGWNWAGPRPIVRYLGIPFAIEPSISDMWDWVYSKINTIYIKWQTHSLSHDGRVQVVQKVFSSHHLYFASTCLFATYQNNMLEKIIRHFLWSDGMDSKKRHCVKWEWCCLSRRLGSLGLKDIKTHGLALASKWIYKALWGNEPWKVLVRNNIERSVIRKGKQWSNIPLKYHYGGFQIEKLWI